MLIFVAAPVFRGCSIIPILVYQHTWTLNSQAYHLDEDHRKCTFRLAGLIEVLASMSLYAISGIYLFLIYTDASMTRPISIHPGHLFHLVSVVLVVT